MNNCGTNVDSFGPMGIGAIPSRRDGGSIMADNIYVVRFLPSRKLLMLTDKAGLQVILRLNKEPIARLENESPVVFHNTTLHGTVDV